MEVVEIAPSPPWLVEGVDLPALQDGYLPWESGLLDAPRYLELPGLL